MKRILSSIAIGIVAVLVFLFVVRNAPISISKEFLVLVFFAIVIISFLIFSIVDFVGKRKKKTRFPKYGDTKKDRNILKKLIREN